MKWLARLGAFGLLAALAAGVALCMSWWTAGPGHSVNRETAARLRNGMSWAQVETILGAPPGDYATGVRRRPDNLAWDEVAQVAQWASDDVFVAVLFDDRLMVESISLHPRDTRSFLSREFDLWFGR